MFGIDGGEFVVLALLALFLIGPERLPGLAKQAAKALHDIRRWTQRTRDDIGRELGPEFENFDLADLNPRRFVQKHLLDPLTEDDEDDQPLVPTTYGHASLSSGATETGSSGTGSHAVSLDKSPEAGTGRTVSLGSVLDGPADPEGDLLSVGIGPDFTTDVFGEPRVATTADRARTAPTVPAWAETASARDVETERPLFGRDPDTDPADTVDEDAAWDAAFYLPPPYDTDAT